jgi:lysozyme
MPSLKQLLTLRECKDGKPSMKVYKDSVGVLTVGIGHKVLPTDKLKLNDEVDEARVDAFFTKDTAKAVNAANAQATKAGIKDAQFKVYLASVNFQLGSGWNKIQKKAWQFILDGDYASAAQEVGKSKWNAQTPIRVKDFQKALLALPEKKAKGGGAKPP